MRLRLLLPVFAAFLLGLFGTLAVAAAPRASAVSVDEYWKLVATSLQTVDELKDATAQELRTGLDGLATQWEAITEVQLESGENLTIDNQHVLSFLRAEEPDLDIITSLFENLLAAYEKYPNEFFTTKDLQPLDEILARPEFQWKPEQPNPIGEWFQKLLNRFFAWLNELLPDFNISLSPLAVILLVFVLLYVFRGLFADLIAEAKLNKNGDSGDEVLTADSAFQRAQSLSRGGDYRAAVRYLYLSSLLLLDERGLLRYDRTRTNREYLRTVADKPELSQPLSEVIDVFDNVWYGYHELDENRFKHYSDRVEELKEKKQ